MMQPKRTKYRKQFKGRNSGLAQRGNTVAFGEYGLKATGRSRMTAPISVLSFLTIAAGTAAGASMPHQLLAS